MTSIDHRGDYSKIKIRVNIQLYKQTQCKNITNNNNWLKISLLHILMHYLHKHDYKSTFEKAKIYLKYIYFFS